MKTMWRKAYVYVVILTITLFAAGADFNAYAQRPYRVTDRQVENQLITLERNADAFWRDFQIAIDRSTYNGTRTEDEITNYVRDFENAIDRMRERFNSRNSVSADVEEVLNRATFIDQFLNQYRFSTTVTRNWELVKSDLNRLANFYNVNWNWNRTGFPTTGGTGIGNNRPNRVNDAAVSNLLQTLERDADYFNRSLTSALDRSALNGTQAENEVAEYVRDFENATDRLKQNFDSRNSVAGDVEEVLNRAANIDNFLRQNRLAARVNTDWNRVRDDLTRLAGLYNVSWDWNRYNVPGRGTYGGGATYGSDRLTGTYRLDTARSMNVESEIDRAIGDLAANQRERVRRAAQRRLAAPEYIAIERVGSEIRLASSNSPQVSFTADGRARTETMPNGRSMTVNASIVNNQVVIDYTGDRANDFYVAFNPTRNGDELRVTRRVYLENVNRQITIESVYTRTSNVAQFDSIYRENNTGGNYGSTTPTGDFIIPNGTRLTGVLNTDLDTKTSQVGDRFTMEVTSPGEYRGAIIEGRVASVERSGRVTGRASLGLDFETVRLRNGSSYQFRGLVDSVASADNSNVSITNEGQVREGDSQTNRTVTRTTIGAALGALIGAIAGGGEGAAIGAGVGAGAGAGSVILQGRDDLSLRQGTQITVTASSPRSVANLR